MPNNVHTFCKTAPLSSRFSNEPITSNRSLVFIPCEWLVLLWFFCHLTCVCVCLYRFASKLQTFCFNWFRATQSSWLFDLFKIGQCNWGFILFVRAMSSLYFCPFYFAHCICGACVFFFVHLKRTAIRLWFIAFSLFISSWIDHTINILHNAPASNYNRMQNGHAQTNGQRQDTMRL